MRRVCRKPFETVIKDGIPGHMLSYIFLLCDSVLISDFYLSIFPGSNTNDQLFHPALFE